jgi:hypothetical protein
MAWRLARPEVTRHLRDEFMPAPRGLHRFYVRHEYAVVYAVAGTSYVLVGMHVKVLLNWIVGPLWPVAFMWLGPVLVRRVTGWQDPLP